MTIKLISSVNQTLYEEIGSSSLRSWKANLPSEIKIEVYSEDNVPGTTDIFQACPSLKDFIARHVDRFDQQDKRELHHGAIRFSYKSFAVFTNLLSATVDHLIWLDIDVEIFNQVDMAFIESLLPKGDQFVTALFREGSYPETGFVAYNLDHPQREPFAEEWRDLYVKDSLFSLPEWHDGYLFGFLIDKHFVEEEVINLSPKGKGYDHVFINSRLGKYMDHMKGARKEVGHSYTADLEDSAPSEMKRRLGK